MKERPSWLREVHTGGKADKPETQPTPEVVPSAPAPGRGRTPGFEDMIDPDNLLFRMQRNAQPAGEGSEYAKKWSEIEKENELIDLYLKLRHNPPADFRSKVRPERVMETAPGLLSWSVESLYKYLSGPEVWKRPSFTEAVFEEVRLRMLHGNGSLAPRIESFDKLWGESTVAAV